MTDSGLSDRLRQKSRRAGLAVGLSMALTIAICIGGATVIYAALIEPLNQFVPVLPVPQAPAAVQGGGGGAGLSDNSGVSALDQPAESNQAIAAAPTQAPAPEPTPTPVPEPTEEPQAFNPDFQIRGDQTVNLRAEPSRTDSAIVTSLPPGTPLEFLDEEAPTENPVQDGEVWMRFGTQGGEEGWVREIDVVQFVP
jgi:hypothetical protein